MLNNYIHIVQQFRLIKIEQLIIKKLIFKLSNQMRHFKEMKMLKHLNISLKQLIDKSVQEIKDEQLNTSNLQTSINNIQSFIVTLSFIVNGNVKRKLLIQFQLITFGALSRINECLNKVSQINTKINDGQTPQNAIII